jgi:hypothetical protein
VSPFYRENGPGADAVSRPVAFCCIRSAGRAVSGGFLQSGKGTDRQKEQSGFCLSKRPVLQYKNKVFLIASFLIFLYFLEMRHVKMQQWNLRQ